MQFECTKAVLHLGHTRQSRVLFFPENLLVVDLKNAFWHQFVLLKQEKSFCFHRGPFSGYHTDRWEFTFPIATVYETPTMPASISLPFKIKRWNYLQEKGKGMHVQASEELTSKGLVSTRVDQYPLFGTKFLYRWMNEKYIHSVASLSIVLEFRCVFRGEKKKKRKKNIWKCQNVVSRSLKRLCVSLVCGVA